MRVLNYKLIETPDELAGIIEVLGKQDALAVDLEADSMFHYKEKVCLVQLATRIKIFLLIL
jgi:ribonuclease D